MKTFRNAQPPKWVEIVFSNFISPRLLESTFGDLEEKFYSRIIIGPIWQAKLLFILEAIGFLRFVLIPKRLFKLNSISMLQNYLRIAFRSLLKQRFTSVINIFGLGISLACAIIITMYIDFQYSLDQYHANSKSIYLLTSFMDKDGSLGQWTDSPEPMGPAITTQLAGIVSSTRYQADNGIIRYGDIVFAEPINFVDPDFFKMFTFPVISGTTGEFEAKQVIINKEIAIKYFGTNDPLDKDLSITLSGKSETFKVIAVMDIPVRSSFKFSILIPYQTRLFLESYQPEVWQNHSKLFIQLNSNNSAGAIIAQLGKFRSIYNEVNTDSPIEKFELVPLGSLSATAHKLRDPFFFGVHPVSIILVGGLALALMLLSSFNYVNIAISSASSRLKEIGLRKVFGSTRLGLIKQFMTENLLICILATSVGFLLAYAILWPNFNQLLTVKMPFGFSSTSTGLLSIGSTVLVACLFSGLYPSLFIARFSPTQIFKGKEKFGSKNKFTRGLLTAQFILSFFTIALAVIFFDQSNYFKNKDWGYRHDDLVIIHSQDWGKLKNLRDKIGSFPEVKSMAGTVDHLGAKLSNATIDYQLKKIKVVLIETSLEYPDLIGLEVKRGRLFDSKIESDKLDGVIINEVLQKTLGLTDPVDQAIKIGEQKYFIVGVVSDFQYSSAGFYAPIEPALLKVAPEESYSYLAIRTEPKALKIANEKIELSWKELFPDIPYSGVSQDSFLEGFFDSVGSSLKFLGFVGVLALIITCMGLFGLVSYTIAKRLKDYSVRKVFGASSFQISLQVLKSFGWLLLLAVAIAGPITSIAVGKVIELMFPDGKPISALPYLVSLGLISCASLLTVVSLLAKLNNISPSRILKENG